MINIMATLGTHPGLYSVTCFIMALIIGFLTKVLAGAWPAIEKTYTSFIRGVLRQIVAKHQSNGSSPSTATNYGGRNFSSNNSNPQNSNTSNPSNSNHSSVNPVSNNNSKNSNQNNPSNRNDGDDPSSNGRETNGVPDTNGADDNTGTHGRFSDGSSTGNPPAQSSGQVPTDSNISNADPGAASTIKNNNRQGGSKLNSHAGGNRSNNTNGGNSAKNQAVKDNGNQHQGLDAQPQGFGAILGSKTKPALHKAGDALSHTSRAVGNATKGLGHAVAHPDIAASKVLSHPIKNTKGAARRIGNIGRGIGETTHGIKSGIGAVKGARNQAQDQQVNGLGGDQSNDQLSTNGDVTTPEAADYGKAADQMLNQSGGLNSKTAANNNSENNSPISQNSVSSGKGSQNSAKNSILQHGLNSHNNHLNSHRNGNRNSQMLHNLHNSKRVSSIRANNRRNGNKFNHSSRMQSLSPKAGSMHHINMPRTMQQAHRNIQSALGQHRAAKSALSSVKNTPNVSPSRQHAAENRVKQAGHHLKTARMAGSMLYESNPTNRNLVRPGTNKLPTNHQTRAALSNVFHAQNNLVHAGHQHAPKATMKSLGTKLNTAKNNAKSIGLKPMTFSSRPHIAKTMKTLNTGLAHAISGYRPTPSPKMRAKM